MQSKLVKKTSTFRYVLITSDYFSEKFMSSYTSLHKIAELLIKIHAEHNEAKPLAICVLDTTTNFYKVVGVLPKGKTSSYKLKK